MILVDANLLVYAYNSTSPENLRARAWLEEALSGVEPIRLAWTVVFAFLRLTTHPKVFTAPMPMTEAIGIVSEWLQQPAVAVLEPSERHWEILSGLLTRSQARGALVMDSHLAALALEHGAVLCTADRDFTRFEGLQLRFPLASA